MPEHVHLLMSEPGTVPLSVVLQVLKQRVSRRLKRDGDVRFWQLRYYDFNVWSHEKTVEKLKYMHRNPVVRGLWEKPEDWPWSSFLDMLLRLVRWGRSRLSLVGRGGDGNIRVLDGGART